MTLEVRGRKQLGRRVLRKEEGGEGEQVEGREQEEGRGGYGVDRGHKVKKGPRLL